MTTSTPTRARRVFAPFAVAVALLPTVAVVQRAFAEPPPQGDDAADPAEAKNADPDDGEVTTPAAQQSKRRKAVLAAITATPSSDTALINVTKREMPASPDILNLGKRSTRALARCLSDNVDDRLRRSCAGLLGRLGDKAALSALQGALEAWDVGVRRAAIEALRSIPDPSSFEPLRKLFLREEEESDSRIAVLGTMGVLSDQRAVKLLRGLLASKRDEDSPLRAPAFEALWKSRHLMARTTLVGDLAAALASGDPSLVLHATYAAAELRSPELVRVLIPLMQHADAKIRNRAVYALGRIGDKAASKALLAQVPKVRESRMLNNIAFALERLDPASFYATAEGLVTHKQAAIRMNAAYVLGDVRRPEGLPLLRGALDDKNDYVRASAIAAIGKLDAPEAAPLLERFISDPNPTLRQEAIYAIDALTGGKRADLIFKELFPSKQPAVQMRAAIALGRHGDLRVSDFLLGCLEDGRCALRDVEGFMRTAPVPGGPGRVLLAWAKGRSDLTDLVATLKPAGAGPIAASDMQWALAHHDQRRTWAGIDLAGDLAEAGALPTLEPLLANDVTTLRLHAAVALVRFGKADADAVILRDLDNAPQVRLPAIVRLVRRIREPAARARLTPALLAREKGSSSGGGDVPVALAAAAIRLDWDAEGAIFRFLDALAAPTTLERDLAERHLQRDRRPVVTWLLRRALARETREATRDRLRKLLDARAGFSAGA